jgi:hypothetical protein
MLVLQQLLAILNILRKIIVLLVSVRDGISAMTLMVITPMYLTHFPERQTGV